MLRIQGLVEGLVPIRETISDRSRENAHELVALADTAVAGLEVSSFAFYAKGVHTGYCSALPFLASLADSANVRASNRALGEVIDSLHARAIKVGAIVQIHRYEGMAWGQDPVWESDDPRSPHVLAAADRPAFRSRLRLVLHEVVTLFPELDFLFLECEPFTERAIAEPLRAWLAGRGLQIDGPIEELTYDSEISRTTKALGIRTDSTWSTEGLAFGVDFTRAAVEVAEETLEDADWPGARGLVYSPDGPGSRFVPVATAGERWWLVPRVSPGATTRTPVRRRATRQHLLHLKRRGRRVCLLLELPELDGSEAASEACDLAELSRETLDGILVGHAGRMAPDDLVRRLGAGRILPTR